MKPLLYNYFIDYSKEDKIHLILLCLLHELRVVSVKQLIDFCQFDNMAKKSSVYGNLKKLKEKNLVECSQIGLTKFYYLTKEGHN
ncbi:ArsR family transcriptional regulator, partial [Enterococcus faecalis]|nr:ArsR family transcriptional regulator [Enterococcus faecalis]